MWRNHPGGEFSDCFAAIPGDTVAKAAKAPSGGGYFGFQQRPHTRADAQVSTANDTLGDAAGPVVAGGTHRRNAIHELDLTQGRHLRRATLAIHRAAFKENGRDDVVSAAEVGQQFRKQVAAALGRIPEVVVRINYR